MGSLQQQGGGQVNSNRIVSVAETPPPGKEYDEQLQQKPGWKKFLTHVGPGFLVSLAYLDPGNLETDRQAGANHGYEMILSFKLSIVLILLLKFSSTSTKMGPQKNSIFIIVFSWALGLGIIGISIYYLITTSMECLIHNSLPKVGNVFIGILVFPLYGSIYDIYNIFDVAKRQSCHARRADKVQPDCPSPDGKRA